MTGHRQEMQALPQVRWAGTALRSACRAGDRPGPARARAPADPNPACPPAGEVAGLAVVEYVLLLALVALAGGAALVLLGASTRGPASWAHQITVQLQARSQAGGGSGGGSGDSWWCTSESTGCIATVPVEGTVVVHFWATGGEPPYSYALAGQPGFARLASADYGGGTGEVVISPVLCSDVGLHGPMSLTVTPSLGVGTAGMLTFSVRVARGPC